MRILSAAKSALGELRGFFPRLWSIFRELLNEIVGLMFLVIALFFTVSANGLVHTFNALDDNPDAFTRLVVIIFAVLGCGYFGVSSFIRARRISRSRQDEFRG